VVDAASPPVSLVTGPETKQAAPPTITDAIINAAVILFIIVR
jgi:hypothetical protein